MAKQSTDRKMKLQNFSHTREIETFVNDNGIKQEDILQISQTNFGDYMLVYFEDED